MGPFPAQRDSVNHPCAPAPRAPEETGPHTAAHAPAPAPAPHTVPAPCPTARTSLPGNSLAPGAARRFIRAALADWAEPGPQGPAQLAYCGEEFVYEAGILVNELVTNAVVHAGTTVDLLCRLESGDATEPAALVIEVSDHHPARALRGAPRRVRDDDLAAFEHGRGLHVVAALAECWGITYRTGLKTVWVRLAADTGEPPPPDADGHHGGTPCDETLHDVRPDLHHDVHHDVHPHEAADAPLAPDASEVPVLPGALEAPSAAHAPVVPDVHDVAEAGAMPAPPSVPESRPHPQPHPASEPRPESPAAPTAPESLPEELVAVEPLAEAVPESHGMSEAAVSAELADLDGAPEAELAPGTGTGTGTGTGAETAALPGTPEPTDTPDATGTTDTPAPPGASGTDRGTDLAIGSGTDPGDATPDAEPTPAVTIAPDLEHPRASYVLRVNGADRPVTEAWVGESLLYVLRERLGLAGAKDGCSQGECGACNVQVDGRLVASCLVPAATAAGSEVRTVEGLATDGEPSDVQRALAECGAVQCGFCIPGMAMTVHDLLEGNHAPTELETRQALCGNLCRCSGYRGVLDAVKEVVAGREAAGALADEARIPHQAPPGAGSAKPPHTHDGGMA